MTLQNTLGFHTIITSFTYLPKILALFHTIDPIIIPPILFKFLENRGVKSLKCYKKELMFVFETYSVFSIFEYLLEI